MSSRGSDEAGRERELLFTAGIRLLPGFQDFRRGVLAHVVLRRAFELTEQKKQLSVSALSHVEGKRISVQLTPRDVREALVRLEQNGLVKVDRRERKPRGVSVSLTPAGKEKICQDNRETAELFREVTAELFRSYSPHQLRYEEAFTTVLCQVFSVLGREYVASATGRKEIRDAIAPALLRKTCNQAERRFVPVKADVLLSKCYDFLLSTDPRHTRLAWYMAQGYFALMALGAAENVFSFASSLLSEKTLYLDTNVLFHAVLPGMPRYEGLRILATVCEKAGSRMAVARPTVDEFAHSFARQRDDARQLVDKLPNEILNEISDPVMYVIETARAEAPDKSAAEIISGLPDPRTMITRAAFLRVVDDEWFQTGLQSDPCAWLMTEVITKCKELRSRKKPRRVAEHDALLLLYMPKENAAGRPSLLVTLDGTLPYCKFHTGESAVSAVMPLDALLQWVCPSLQAHVDNDRLSAVFLAAVAERLVPSGLRLGLSDLRMLDHFGVEVERLPVVDLSECIARLKSLLPQIDPGTAEGRERLLGEIYRFLHAPERHYADELQSERQKRRQEEEARQRIERKYRTLRRTLTAGVILAAALALTWWLGEGETTTERLRSGWLALSSLAALPFALPKIIVWLRRFRGGEGSAQ